MDAAERLRAGETSDPQSDDAARAHAEKAWEVERLAPGMGEGDATPIPSSHP